MKSTLAYLFLVTIMVYFKSEEKILGDHKAGYVQIGMQADELYGYYEHNSLELFDQFLEATFSPAFNIKNEHGMVELVAELNCNTIWRIKVVSPDYKTKEGVHIGSTLGELKEYFSFEEVLRGEGNIVVYSKEKDLSFLLDVYQMEELGVDLNERIELADIPNEVRVAAILVL